MDLLVTALLGVVVILVVALFTVRSVLTPEIPVKGTTNVPGPSDGGRTWPILGDAWRFIGVTNMKELLDVVERTLADSHCGKALKLWIGPKLTIFVTDPKIAEVILTGSKSNDKDPDTYKEFNKFSDGVFSRHGKRWSGLRKGLNRIVQPNKIVEEFSKTFAIKSEVLCEVMDEKCDQGVFDTFETLLHWSIDVAAGNLWGVPTNSLKEKPRFDIKFMLKSVELILKKYFQILYKIGWISYFSSMRREETAIKEESLKTAKWFIEERLRILAASGVTPEDPGFTPESYIDVVIQNNKIENLSGTHASTAILDFCAAAFDSSAVLLSTICLYLAQHPEYQEKAYKEQIEIMGDSLRAPTQEELDKMNYLWMIYMETLRHVGVPGVVRIVNSTIETEGFIFPEGASVYVSLHSLQMDPKYWVKTKEFYPDNFLPEHVERRPKGAFQPFSAGVRNCPGQRFAVTGGNIVLSMLLRRFSFSSPLRYDEMEYKYILLIESAKGYPIEVTRRKPVK